MGTILGNRRGQADNGGTSEDACTQGSSRDGGVAMQQTDVSAAVTAPLEVRQEEKVTGDSGSESSHRIASSC